MKKVIDLSEKQIQSIAKQHVRNIVKSKVDGIVRWHATQDKIHNMMQDIIYKEVIKFIRDPENAASIKEAILNVAMNKAASIVRNGGVLPPIKP